MNLLEMPTIDNMVKEQTKEITTDMKLHNNGWTGPVRTQGRKGLTSCKVITYKKNDLQVELAFVFDEENVKINTYIFFSKNNRGVSYEDMQLFMIKIEEELK